MSWHKLFCVFFLSAASICSSLRPYITLIYHPPPLTKQCLMAWKQAETHTQILTFSTSEHIWSMREKSTVILHNKSPTQVPLLYSLWANQLFRASISSSIHRKHVSIRFGSFSSLRKPSCSFFPFYLFFLFVLSHFLSVRTALGQQTRTTWEACLTCRIFFFSALNSRKRKKKKKKKRLSPLCWNVNLQATCK